jgi:TetR/AcrR family transcriptional regulator, ethionamide resistance regulator
VSTPGRQTEKRAQVEESVLQATEDLLGEGATFAELGIERIATRAGISRTAFYFYFRDKRELLVRLTEEVNGQLMAAADAWWTGEDQDIRGALERVGDIYREHGLLLRAVVEVSTYDEDFAQFWRGQVGRFVEATRDRIRAEQQAGRALDGDPDAIAFALIWMTERTFYQQRVQGVPADIDAVVDALAAVFTRAVYGGS